MFFIVLLPVGLGVMALGEMMRARALQRERSSATAAVLSSGGMLLLAGASVLMLWAALVNLR